MYVRSQGIHNELKQLENTLSNIRDLLTDASHKEITDKSVKQWLNGLQHLAYDIDDLLDDLATEAMHRELTHDQSGAITSKVRKLIPTCCTNFSLSHRLLHKLDSITTRLQHLEKQKSDLGLIVKDEKPKNSSRRYETSLPDASSVVGREDEVERLLNELLRDETSKENFSIVPIVGMGGVGKTTLARLLYNDIEVNDHFELKVWVCVSDDFDVFKISGAIFRCVTKEDKEFKDLNQLQMALTEQFKGRRFMLVVDDVWNESYGDWEILVRPFHSCASRSKVIMTNRTDQLLIKLGFDHLDRLDSLSHEDALCLFALHALGVDNFDSHATLKQQGEGIVKKCDGLPLAIKAMGRLLRTKTYGEDWDDVLNSEIWDIEISNEIIPALRLSYHDLSADLKQLFAYCSLFPKDFLFNKEELVLLWMAEGFLNPSNATMSPERLGHEYFESLLSMSFFQHAPNENSLFMMHDLMNDLATIVAGEYFLRSNNHKKIRHEALSKHRYMSFTREQRVGYHKFEAFESAKSLRTLLSVPIGLDKSWGYFYLSNKILVDLLPELPLLRVVLSLSHFETNEVHEFIGSLKHLWYLNLSKTSIKELPENVGNLYNLQTLIIFGCRKLTKLPKSFVKLKRLRHFDIRDTPLLENMPLGIGGIKSLCTLTKIIIDADDGFTITELKGFKNLHGIISIEGLQKVQSIRHTQEVNLSLKEITKLELKWVDVFDSSQNGPLEKEVLNKMEPNIDRLKEFSASVVVAFPSLKVLRFEDMSSWEGWSTKKEGLDAAFPCLQELHIKNCPKLIDVSLEALPSLKILEIDGCGYVVLRSLVQAASSITKMEIRSISGLKDEMWKGVIEYLRAFEEVSINICNEIRYLWESEAEASKVLVNFKKS